ncbi:response regulator [Halalkalibacterium halodurans]|uniref:Two-component response regulator n=1 Tax=Halalkalibacterium halodurans (strain ATCC BAA-125 / DSM 18197 / FERM 7344 / JCM 9153 / C-125) TaxID=272558 RepID=Q9K9D3_HALH5|nr:response regulator [Halalkalibacterium halodurans]MED4173962.1 response regulator [Halalkalibacterium halodurans]BAB06434.1 two-component response regulator [Halalkalibacterium halodurans C-125]
MNFFITDDDVTVRSILAQIIEDEQLGQVVGEAEDGSELDGKRLNIKQVDILLIDLLMPNCDGLEAIQKIKPEFKGKIIMISQIESKELISEAYLLGIEHYIMKPINKIEVLSVIRKVINHTRLEQSLYDIQKSLSNVLQGSIPTQVNDQVFHDDSIKSYGQYLLSELGIAGESGSKDLMNILMFLYTYEKEYSFEKGFPALKDIFEQLASEKLGDAADERDVRREVKAAKQRVRRAVYQSLEHVASLGLIDFSNPKFEEYASHFFDFSVVRSKMTELKNETSSSYTSARINVKKFTQALYYEAKRLMQEKKG